MRKILLNTIFITVTPFFFFFIVLITIICCFTFFLFVYFYFSKESDSLDLIANVIIIFMSPGHFDWSLILVPFNFLSFSFFLVCIFLVLFKISILTKKKKEIPLGMSRLIDRASSDFIVFCCYRSKRKAFCQPRS